MICNCVQNLTDLYVQGRLIGFQARWIESHVSGCVQCAAEIVSWKHLLKGLRSLPTLSAPEDLKATLKKAASATNKDRRRERLPIDFARGSWPERAHSRALAFGLTAFVLSLSASIFGPGVPSQECSNDASSVCIATPASSESTIRRIP